MWQRLRVSRVSRVSRETRIIKRSQGCAFLLLLSALVLKRMSAFFCLKGGKVVRKEVLHLLLVIFFP